MDLAASERLVPLHSPDLIERITRRAGAIRHPRAAFLTRAARRFLEAQEAFGKTLSAIDAGDGEAIGILLWDAVHHLLVTLAFLNEQPFTTFARFIPEARSYGRAPAGLDALLDRVVAGGSEREGLRELLLVVFAQTEALFAAEGVDLWDASLDPAVPNRRWP